MADQELNERVAGLKGRPSETQIWCPRCNGWQEASCPIGEGPLCDMCDSPQSNWAGDLGAALRDLWPDLAKAGWTFILYRSPEPNCIGCLQPYDLNLCGPEYVFGSLAAAARLLAEAWCEKEEGEKREGEAGGTCQRCGADSPDAIYCAKCLGGVLPMCESEKEEE